MNYTESFIRTDGLYFDIYDEQYLKYLPKKLLYISNNNFIKYQIDSNIAEEILGIPFQTIFYTWRSAVLL
jgi:hypothetical protein